MGYGPWYVRRSRMTATATPQPSTHFTCPKQFPEWLERQKISLGFSTYQTGKLFLIGLAGSGQLGASEWSLPTCMGLWTNGQTIWLGSKMHIWRLENALAKGANRNGKDRVFAPRIAYTTGDLDTHDIAVDGKGRVLFINTQFNCLATLDDDAAFRPVWRPRFISKLVAEDRCHLNGLCMKDGKPAYVTAVAQSDVVDGWRDRRRGGGCVIDVESGEVVAQGLSMPHSPRYYRNKLWVHDSGAGFFGAIDLKRGVFEPLTFCPGYLRGLAFSGDFAVVGLSRPRHQKTFGGLPIDENLQKRGAEARCGIHIINLRTGDISNWLRIEGAVEELYDVVVLDGVRNPAVLPIDSEELRKTVTVDAATAARVFA